MTGFPTLEFIALMAAFGVNVVIPGADFAMVLRQSIVSGRRAALLTACGIATAILVHGAYTIAGIGILVGQSLLAFNIIKWAGVAYLLWLAISAFRAPAPVAPEHPGTGAAPDSDFSAFALGFLTNMLNPKAVLFFLALFSTLVSPERELSLKIGYLLAMSLMLLIWFTLVALFFTTPRVRSGFFRLGRWFNRVCGLTFMALALRVALAQRN